MTIKQNLVLVREKVKKGKENKKLKLKHRKIIKKV